MATTRLPVELEVESQKILKKEIELQEIFKNLEHDADTRVDFDNAVIYARATISSFKTNLNKFQESIKEWDGDDAVKDEITDLRKKHESILYSMQKAFQRACITGKNRIDTIESRELLHKNFKSPEQKVRQRNVHKEDIASKSVDITENLLSIARMMDVQVRQSEESNAVLQTSSQQIKETHDEYKGLTGIISVSRKLLNKYNRRELTDTLLLFFGLILFFATVLYIISKRL